MVALATEVEGEGMEIAVSVFGTPKPVSETDGSEDFNLFEGGSSSSSDITIALAARRLRVTGFSI